MDQLYNCFKKMGHTDKRASLLDYSQLMLELAQFLDTPTFVNNYHKFDKNLKGNLIKRCLLRPFRQNFMGMDEPEDLLNSSTSSTAPLMPIASNLELELFGEELLKTVVNINKMFSVIRHGMTEY
jgi:hypothetical protein